LRTGSFAMVAALEVVCFNTAKPGRNLGIAFSGPDCKDDPASVRHNLRSAWICDPSLQGPDIRCWEYARAGQTTHL